ncbi:hypothetical protein B0T10DRAFT_593244 [Thelonectria olida]|uniref:Uncharacterized protein n=1 Tax=Thelonectria olida TaxID=1576542 RepID=A0A9P8VQN8_9HYPO|nr:hypothetical protein B0T10DRAFT_593244 [Thelonectria olida]
MVSFHTHSAMLLLAGLASLLATTLAQETANLTVEDCSFFSSTGINPECWEILEMNNHLNDWWSKNSANCTAAEKGFSRCYLDEAGYITWTCDIVSVNGCSPPPSGRSAGYLSYHEFYVFWNIYSINQFFSNYHQALLNGQAEAIGTVAEIVKTVAPPTTKNPNTPLFSPIWGVATGQFAALGALLSGTGATLVFGALTGVLAAGSGLFGALFPKTEVYQVPWEGLSEALSQHVDDYQKAVGNALTEIQSDFDTFYALTSNGAFSQRLATSLPEDTSFMFHNLLKWVFNQAIQAAGYFVVKNTGVDPTKIPVDAFDCTTLNDKGICGPIWYNGKDSYGLARADDIGMDQMEGILTVAFERNWTTPEELYVDSQSCRGKNGTEAFDVEDLTLSCVSNTPVCEFNFDYNPFQEIRYHTNPHEFLDCPGQRGWGVPPYHSSDAGIPITYLGPFLMTGHVYNEKSG